MNEMRLKMKVAVTTLVLVMIVSLPGHAVETDLKTGETCIGLDCADKKTGPSSDTKGIHDKGAKASDSDPCETVAQKIYGLCMASPGADPSNCSRE
jgi:hypothetical protein